MDKHEELHGGDFETKRYSAAQIEEVNAMIAAYTPDEFNTAVALAEALGWEQYENFDDDYFQRRVIQRRLQGRGPAAS